MEKSHWKWRGRHNTEVRNGKQRQTYRYHARKFIKKNCETCGTDKKLQVHHKDRDWTNNEPSNLETLCATCHMKWHHEHDHIVTLKEHVPCRVCGKPYELYKSREDLCSTHRANLLKYGVEVVPKAEPPPCRVCGAPYRHGTSRRDLCAKCRKTHKATPNECAVCGTKIWASKTHCYKHFKDSLTT